MKELAFSPHPLSVSQMQKSNLDVQVLQPISNVITNVCHIALQMEQQLSQHLHLPLLHA